MNNMCCSENLFLIKIYLLFILQGDYEIVINDYARARSLFHDTEVAVFKKGN